MGRRGGNMTGLAPIEGGEEEGTAIKPTLAKANKSSWGIAQCAYFPRNRFSGNILLVPFYKGIQRGKNTSHIHKVDLGLDAVAPIVFAKILPKELIDMAG